MTGIALIGKCGLGCTLYDCELLSGLAGVDSSDNISSSKACDSNSKAITQVRSETH